VIVIDSSTLAKYILKEPGWDSVARFMEVDNVVTLDLALKEVLNAVRRAYVRGLFDEGIAMEKFNALRELVEAGVLSVEGNSGYLEPAFQIALRTGLTIYDSLFLAQASRHSARLLTSDKAQADAAIRLGIEAAIV